MRRAYAGNAEWPDVHLTLVLSLVHGKNHLENNNNNALLDIENKPINHQDIWERSLICRMYVKQVRHNNNNALFAIENKLINHQDIWEKKELNM